MELVEEDVEQLVNLSSRREGEDFGLELRAGQQKSACEAISARAAITDLSFNNDPPETQRAHRPGSEIGSVSHA